MELIDQIENRHLKPSVATIGFFDGVHKGHQFLIQQVKQLADSEHLSSMVVTFDEHPRRVMQKEYQPQLLSSPQEKFHLLSEQSIDYAVSLHFTMEMSHMTAQEFMQCVLHDQLNVSVLVIGYDHRFGHNRAEGFEDYVRYGKEMGMRVIEAKAFFLEDIGVSSSMVRALVQDGEMKLAARCLGYWYRLKGTIVSGHKVGRKLGFPTANIQVNHPFKLIPSEGVYAVWVVLSGERYKGMLNIGHRPTVDNGNDRSIEVFVLHFSDDVYNQEIEVEFVEKMRDEKRFRSVEELSNQLKKDAETVETIL